MLRRVKETLPFSTTRDFEEQKKGFIVPMEDMKIMTDDGHTV